VANEVHNPVARNSGAQLAFVRRKQMKLASTILIIIGLAGCAMEPTPAAFPRSPPTPTPLQTLITTCDLSTRPELEVLNGKFPLSMEQIQQPGLKLLSIDRVPTGDERAALLTYDQLHRPCVQARIDWCADATHGMVPEVCAAHQKMSGAEEEHLAMLYQGKETFAQYAQAVNSLDITFRNDSTRIWQDAMDKMHQQQVRSAPVQSYCIKNGDGAMICTTQ
jgi:hypothetical protein